MKTGCNLILAAFAALILGLAVAGCGKPNEAATVTPHSLHLEKDSAWSVFDILDVSWTDPVTGTGATLFHGPPSDLRGDNAFASDGYKGQAVDIRVKGYIKGGLAFEEKRIIAADGSTLLSRETVLAYNPKPDTTVIPPKVDSLPTDTGFIPVFPIHPR